MRLFQEGAGEKLEVISVALPAIAHENPLRLPKVLKTKEGDLAERVGFVPDDLAPINNLGPI